MVLHIVVAAGGTGGHLFPAQALALDLLQKHPTAQITFIGMGLNKNRYFQKDLFSFLDIQSGTPFKKSPLYILKALLKVGRGLLQSLQFIGKSRPHLIVGFGSYHTFPAIYAAKLKKVPIVLFESNALPGRVNRFCSRWARLSAVQFPHSAEYLKSNSVCVQMPLLNRKQEISQQEARAYFGLDEEKLTFLIFGGSQGARSINRFICGALDHLSMIQTQFQVIHITGDIKRMDTLKKIYEKHKIPSSIKVFEEKMEYAWSAANLSISRAGSATIAELIAFTVPGILIPYPFGAENHQLKNAAFVTDEVKGTVTLEEKGLEGFTLAKTMSQLLHNNQQVLRGMAQSLKEYRDKESRRDLCSVVLEVI